MDKKPRTASKKQTWQTASKQTGWSRWSKRLRSYSRSPRTVAVIFIVTFAAIGSYLLYSGHAATLPYIFKSDIAGMCLDNYHSGTANGNTVAIANCNGTGAQNWNVNSNGTIENTNGKCLDNWGQQSTTGNPIKIYTCSSSDPAEQWRTTGNILLNPQTGKCITDPNSSTTDDTPLVLSACTAHYKAQVWTATSNGKSGGSGATSPTPTPAPTPTPPPVTQTGSCRKATGPFSVSGTTVKQANGQYYVPYGATLSTLQTWPAPEYDPNKSDTAVTQSEKQIKAIASAWCGNTVRLQIEQDELVGIHGNSINQSYMTAIKQVVSYAESLGLVVVLNAQTERAGSSTTGNEPMATNNTKAFWHEMNQTYAMDPQVIYDLFNEPRNGGVTDSSAWSLWHNGNNTYVGMQTLANYVRADGSKNLFWIEGEGYSNDFQYIIQNTALRITGRGIVYEMHDPTEGGNSTSTVSSWNTEFGDFVNKGIAPVVEGEWTEFSESNWQCWSNAPTAVPQYLQYLQNIHGGLVMWTLAKPFMLNSSNAVDNYNTPNSYRSGYSCTNGINQGAGQDVQNWFNKQNK
jgi:hypothetical protein